VGQLPRAAIEVDRGAERRQALRRLARGEQRVDRLRAVVAPGEVMREHRGPLRGDLAGLLREERRDALVELAALAEEKAFVCGLRREALAEAVLVARDDALRVEDAALLEPRERAGDVDALARKEVRELIAPELPPEHRRDLDDALRRRRQTIEP